MFPATLQGIYNNRCGEQPRDLAQSQSKRQIDKDQVQKAIDKRVENVTSVLNNLDQCGEDTYQKTREMRKAVEKFLEEERKQR